MSTALARTAGVGQRQRWVRMREIILEITNGDGKQQSIFFYSHGYGMPRTGDYGTDITAWILLTYPLPAASAIDPKGESTILVYIYPPRVVPVSTGTFTANDCFSAVDFTSSIVS